MIKYALLFLCLFAFSSCAKKNTLKIQASSTPQAELLAYIKEDLAKEGVYLEILTVDDYNIPNRALAEGEIDANFFQHTPFLEEQKRQFGYPICSLVAVHIEPMGLYTHENLANLPSGSRVALPSDPTNETRALLLLQKAGLITLKEGASLTLFDIVDNPKKLKWQEVDAAFLARTLDEVAVSVIPTNYALLAGLSPLKDAALLEDTKQTFANIVAIREQDLLKQEFLLLKKMLTSEKLRLYIQNTYQGAALPVE